MISSKILKKMGFPNNPALGMTLEVVKKQYKHSKYEEVEPILLDLLKNPTNYYEHEHFAKIAERLAPKPEPQKNIVQLLAEPLPFEIFGAQHIEKEAIAQMNMAMRLPIAVKGALMPDAHAGYGLPIGGVFATKNAVIPYGVGVDIGCRMCLSVLPIKAEDFNRYERSFTDAIRKNTKFGMGENWNSAKEHEILESDIFDQLPLLKNMKSKAAKQLGTSGSGNHFVEFGTVKIPQDDAESGLEAGQYVALLSHSGSRGLGATIADHYTRVAMQKLMLKDGNQALAWLDLDDEDGAEYWAAMNLAGDYASACHEVIHESILKEIAVKKFVRIENHHNFAWKEVIDNQELILHRKGATPAKVGEMGIIPGSMTDSGFIVRGNGHLAALNSAAHGAGRKLSRSRAKQSISMKAMKDALKKHQVTLIGGALDEAPMAYKDIHEVMIAQKKLVTVLGEFFPRIVRMDG
jgi:tRNA-splicing ligase RtcB (3'-phosphate/5'-hydroxy nucleic acid ligase)